jgi:hypothetical protein
MVAGNDEFTLLLQGFFAILWASDSSFQTVPIGG